MRSFYILQNKVKESQLSLLIGHMISKLLKKLLKILNISGNSHLNGLHCKKSQKSKKSSTLQKTQEETCCGVTMVTAVSSRDLLRRYRGNRVSSCWPSVTVQALPGQEVFQCTQSLHQHHVQVRVIINTVTMAMSSGRCPLPGHHGNRKSRP